MMRLYLLLFISFCLLSSFRVSSSQFAISITGSDDVPPTISSIGDQTTPVNTPTGAISFTIGDAETLPADLTVSGSSSNTTLVTSSNIIFGGTDSDRNVTITPETDQTGSATITIEVNDGSETSSTTFILTVTASNVAPTISTIGDQSTSESTATSAIPITVGDTDDPVADLVLSGSSGNTTLVPNANIAFGGSGADRTVTITPAAGQSGTATITVEVSDGTDVASTSFTLTVTAINDAPTISTISNQSTSESTATSAIPITVGDTDNPVAGLTLSGSSSNTTLVPNANIVFGGTGADRTVTITPAAGQSGTATITVEVSDGTDVASTSFTLTVTATNDAPTISTISNQSTSESTATSAIPITVGDTDNPVAGLTLSGSSSNTTLVPNGNIVFGGSGADRTVTITPSTGQSGTATITIQVSDGADNASTSFALTVNAVNDPPTISAITDQATPENTATSAISITVGDTDNPVGGLTLSGSSSNTTLVPNGNIVFGGSGADRTVTITPATGQSGTATITIQVSDGADNASTSFTLTVNAVNDPPTISAITDQSTPANTATGAIPFTVGDPDNPVGDLTVSGSSSNVTVVPNASIVFGGSGANRTVTITPAAGQSGATNITITVTDGTANASTSFTLSVNDVNDPPTISTIANQTTAENTATAAIPFTIGDAETSASSLTVTASSSNTSLVPAANITFGGSGANRSVSIDPGASQSGTATITITVSDGSSSTSTSFDLTITPVNDNPTITPISNQTTAENTPTPAIPFNIGDAETPAVNLVLSATSSVTTLVSNGNITFGGSGSDRTVTITPTSGQNGSTEITISVSDGSAVTSTSFTLTVSSVNDGPTITSISNQTTNEEVATAALPFTLSDPDTPIGSLTVTAISSNETLVPNNNIVLFGDNISRTVTITPASDQTGTTTITLTVTDGTASASTSFQVTVTAVNDPPSITAINNQTTGENDPTDAIAFKVNDAETASAALVVTGSSSNVALVPNANIVVGGSGEDRTVTITPASGQSGTTTITLSVSDGSATSSTAFQLTVASVNDAPTITSIVAQTTNEDVATTAVTFTIGDGDSPINSLTVSGTSSNKSLIPDANISISNTGATRTITVTPASNQNGKSTITLTVSDGSASAQTTFELTVNPVNDPPVITGQDLLTTQEETSITLLPENFTIVDPDNTPTDFSLVILPGNYSVSTNVVTPPTDFDGELQVLVRVLDGKSSSPEFVAIINVTDVNVAPSITGQFPNPVIRTMNQSFTLTTATSSLTIQDPDSEIKDLVLIVSPGENYSLSGADQTTVTPLLNYVGPLNVVVRVSDGKAESAPFTLKINIVLPSATPLINGQEPLIINEDEVLTLAFEHLSVTDTDDNYPTGFTMNVGNGPNYSVVSNQITPAANFNGILSVNVTVSDGENLSEPFAVRVYVVPVNDAPQITYLEPTPIRYEPGSGSIQLTEMFECVDTDNEFLSYAEVGLIDVNYSAANDELIFENNDASPIRSVYDASKGVLSLIGYATAADYMQAIKTIRYNYRLTLDPNGEPSQISTESKRIYINISDGLLVSENKERAIELETSVELSIPNAFTPNGDEENSTWVVQPVTKTDQFNDTVVRVYNKRGLLVFETVGLENEWDGTYKGEQLPVDTYYYTIDLKLSFIKKTYKGSVTILR
ncbi:tandem-95 repeat protein [Chryseolinea sp. H1M3-3]|uniref:tandem-95 repeat protein n=1 Tax=Chryseolinea sp. H1M3-3 TaxID=3034144 RepID=UPI0023EC38B6|nr:tandem-95 repeat protein [Chryseolinea sp. H1M3-3]